LFRLRHFVPKHTLILLYKALIQPHITYGIEVWGSTYQTYLASILYTEKMAMRSITFSGFRSHTRPLFQSMGILNVFELHYISVATFMFDLVHHNLPHSLIDYCKIIQHSYSTRQREGGQLHLPHFKTTQGKFSMSFVGSDCWNRLPSDLRLEKTRSRFRNSIQFVLLKNN